MSESKGGPSCVKKDGEVGIRRQFFLPHYERRPRAGGRLPQAPKPTRTHGKPRGRNGNTMLTARSSGPPRTTRHRQMINMDEATRRALANIGSKRSHDHFPHISFHDMTHWFGCAAPYLFVGHQGRCHPSSYFWTEKKSEDMIRLNRRQHEEEQTGTCICHLPSVTGTDRHPTQSDKQTRIMPAQGTLSGGGGGGVTWTTGESLERAGADMTMSTSPFPEIQYAHPNLERSILAKSEPVISWRNLNGARGRAWMMWKWVPSSVHQRRNVAGHEAGCECCYWWLSTSPKRENSGPLKRDGGGAANVPDVDIVQFGQRRREVFGGPSAVVGRVGGDEREGVPPLARGLGDGRWTVFVTGLVRHENDAGIYIAALAGQTASDVVEVGEHGNTESIERGRRRVQRGRGDPRESVHGSPRSRRVIPGLSGGIDWASRVRGGKASNVREVDRRTKETGSIAKRNDLQASIRHCEGVPGGVGAGGLGRERRRSGEADEVANMPDKEMCGNGSVSARFGVADRERQAAVDDKGELAAEVVLILTETGVGATFGLAVTGRGRGAGFGDLLKRLATKRRKASQSATRRPRGWSDMVGGRGRDVSRSEQDRTHAMLFPCDTHHPDRSPPPPPPQTRFSPADTPHSDSGLSLSSSSSAEIMGTPFDLGAQRFEYPFPQAQGSPTDPFLPLSSSISSHAQLPSWPVHISKSFPLTPPPLGKAKAHPKLRTANVREPPVPPGLVKRRSRIAGLKHQSSSEEPSDVNDDIARARRPPRVLLALTEPIPRNPHHPEIVPIKHAASLPIVRPTLQDPAGLAVNDAGSAQGTPRLPVLQRERNVNRVRDQIVLYCWIVAGQLRLSAFARKFADASASGSQL
ncbi:hypothetical protein HD554DRAFT_2329476 [Boletus coccyginus]|nr:hypothetical protein HD554DRAFT_2329476 [Boletus coccyginus]